MARPSRPSGSPSPTGSSGGGGKDDQIAQIQAQIDAEKVQQKTNLLSAEKVRTQISEVGIQIAQINLETKNTSKEIAQARSDKERHTLTDAHQARDLTQQLTELHKQFHEERIARERRRLYEFEGVEI